MRELKFRAWDGKRMSNDVTLTKLAETDYGISFDNVIWLQYTGLKDRNGADIYEGDSLSLNGELWGDVVFEGGAFKIDVGSQTQENTQINQARCARFEVAGNIYENPAKKINKNT